MVKVELLTGTFSAVKKKREISNFTNSIYCFILPALFLRCHLVWGEMLNVGAFVCCTVARNGHVEYSKI